MSDITTSRLMLTPFTPRDWPFFLTLRQHPDVMRYMGEILSEEKLLPLFVQRLRDGARMIKTHAGEPLGDIGLHISSDDPGEADVGYALLPEAQGKGYAAEALRGMCEYGFGELRLNAINAWVLAQNSRSALLLERLGFYRTQILEKAFTLNGVSHDDWVYRLEASRLSAQGC